MDENDKDGAKISIDQEYLLQRAENIDIDTTPQLSSSKLKKSNTNSNQTNNNNKDDEEYVHDKDLDSLDNGIELKSIPDENESKNQLKIPKSKSNVSLKNSINPSKLEISLKSIKSDNEKIVDDKVYNEIDTSTPLSESGDSSVVENTLVDSNNFYDRNLYFEYRDSHRDTEKQGDVPNTPTIVTGVEHKPKDLNDAYDVMKTHDTLKKTSFFKYFKLLFNENKHRWDPIQNPRFHLAAQIITRFGFFSKTLLYASLGIISIAAAVDKKRAIAGPDGVFEELEEIFSSGLIVVFVLGLWSYGCWGIFYVLFDIDDLGHKSAGAILKRFGRIFSSGFYFVLGVDAIRVLIHQKKKASGTQQIMSLLYSHVVGRIIVCILGVTFFVVCIVYLFYAIKPAKFKRELSTERMTKYLYWTSLGFARLGAIGRSMFFGAFGAVLIKAVADIDKGKEGDTTLLGFQGVFQQIANYSATLLFIIAILIVFYAFWCFWLCFFRRLPAHKDPVVARQLLGTKVDRNLRFNGIIVLQRPKKDELTSI